MSPLIAAIEAGGTKFNCAVGTGPGDIRLSKRIPTTKPGETLQEVIAFFDEAQKQCGAFAAIGAHSFVDFNLYTPANAMLLAWISGIAASLDVTPEIGA